MNVPSFSKEAAAGKTLPKRFAVSVRKRSSASNVLRPAGIGVLPVRIDGSQPMRAAPWTLF
jgi:hypothetical protein